MNKIRIYKLLDTKICYKDTGKLIKHTYAYHTQ